MSTSANARNVAENSRRPSTTSGAKSRGPSSRVATREKPFSSGEVIPEDSASNAPPRRTVSDAQKVNGGTRTISERQTGRVHSGTRDNLQVRTRSPIKAPSGDGMGDRIPRERFPVRPNSQPVERSSPAPKNDKKIIRELGSSVQKRNEKVLIEMLL